YPDDLLRRKKHDVRDVKEITDLVEEKFFAFGHRDILPHHDHAEGLAASARAIAELSDFFGAQPPILEFPLSDDGFFDVLWPRPRWRLWYVRGGPRQRLPRCGRQIVGAGLQVRRSVKTEEKVNPRRVPALEVLALREVRVAAEEHLAKAAFPADGDDAVDRRRGAFLRRPVTRAVFQPQHFAGVGQRQDQGMIPPGS